MRFVIGAYRFIEEWFQDREKERVHLELELKFLKNQINPHFIFNSLNNIYSLAYRKHPQTPQMIALLSQILRYTLYECSAAAVPLEKEVKLIENYIQLHNLSQEQNLNVDFYHEGIDEKHQIAPMLLINFVENAYKHSDVKEKSEGWINIEMFVEAEQLHFIIENSICNSEEILPSNKELLRTGFSKKQVQNTLINGTPNTTAIGGIGLENTLRQLELHYPGKNKVDFFQEDGRFKVYLRIDIIEPVQLNQKK